MAVSSSSEKTSSLQKFIHDMENKLFKLVVDFLFATRIIYVFQMHKLTCDAGFSDLFESLGYLPMFFKFPRSLTYKKFQHSSEIRNIVEIIVKIG